jgi:hypothetical protein
VANSAILELRRFSSVQDNGGAVSMPKKGKKKAEEKVEEKKTEESKTTCCQ